MEWYEINKLGSLSDKGREVKGAHLVDMGEFLRLVRREVGSEQALSCALAAQHSASCTCR